jgi:hypothetical protein
LDRGVTSEAMKQILSDILRFVRCGREVYNAYPTGR